MIPTNIFNSSMELHAMPQAAYLFRVCFDESDDSEGASELVDINNTDGAVSITATLPKAEYKTVTQWYKGTPKTRIVNMDRSGTTSLKFVVTRDGLGRLNDLFSLDGHMLDTFEEFEHDEFKRSFSKIHIYTLMNAKYSPEDLLSIKNTSAIYTLYNCVVQDYSFSELSYDSTNYVELTVTVHYDYWSCA